MNSAIPHYIPVEEISSLPLSYEWDFWDPYEILGKINESTMNDLDKISDRGQIAFSIGCAEWVVARLSKHLSDTKAFLYIDACWAFQLDTGIASPLAPNEDEWQGSVLAPIDLAIVSILNTYYTTEDGQGAIEAAFSELIPIQVLFDKTPFFVWREKILNRLKTHFPRQENDHWGLPVPKEALNPDLPLDTELIKQYAASNLEQIFNTKNIFIRTFAGDNSTK